MVATPKLLAGQKGPELAVPDLRRQVVRASAAAWPGKWCHRELGGDTDKPENEALWRYVFGLKQGLSHNALKPLISGRDMHVRSKAKRFRMESHHPYITNWYGIFIP